MNIPLLDLWPALGGPKLIPQGRQYRSKAFWRDGDDYNISINPSRNVWFDHAYHRGGGGLSLTQVVLDCKRPQALQWLTDAGFLQPLDDRTRAAKAAIAAEARQVSDYYAGLQAHLCEYRLRLIDLRDMLRLIWQQSEELAEELFDTEHKIWKLDELLEQMALTPTKDLFQAYRACKPRAIPLAGREFANAIEKAMERGKL